MPDRPEINVSIERIDNVSIVSLKVSTRSLDSARDNLQLAPPLNVAGEDPRSLWLGPDRWLLVSNTMTADSVIKNCEARLAKILCNAVDYSSGLVVLRIAGPHAAHLLASGSGIDFRPDKFLPGTCLRTRLAQIAAVIVAEAPEQFDIYVDRGYGTYLKDWLADTSKIAARAAASDVRSDP